MIFGWTRASGTPEKCRNCLIRDETGKRSSAVSCSLVKYTAPSSLSIVDSAGPSGNLKSILSGMWQ